MAMPVAGTKLGPTLHLNLHNIHENVKAYGATGDGVTDDRASIQAAIDAAAANGHGQVLFPPGNYLITSTLTINGKGVRLSGALGQKSDPSPGTWVNSGVRLFGTIDGPLIQRAEQALGAETSLVIEDIGFSNLHATGTCVSLDSLMAPAGVFRCYFRGHNGIYLGLQIFNVTISDCTFSRAGTTLAGSVGIKADGSQVLQCDIAGYEKGIYSQRGCDIIGARIETCTYGLYLGDGFGSFWSGLVAGVGMEANGTGIKAIATSGGLISGVAINGTTGGTYGVDINQYVGATFIGVVETGIHSTNFVHTNNSDPSTGLTFIGCNSTSSWSLFTEEDVQIINCGGVTNIIKAPVIATASLPAAAAQRDGRLVIEDNGAGDRNLIIYAGGQRFRIDGGAAV